MQKKFISYLVTKSVKQQNKNWRKIQQKETTAEEKHVSKVTLKKVNTSFE